MKTDINKGLSDKEVKELINAGLTNVPVKKQSKTVLQIIAGNVFTYFNFVFAIFATLLILVGSYTDMTFLPIIFWNTVIGIVQEIRAKIVLDRLTVVNAPKTSVIRNSEINIINSDQLVKGDLCIFEAGNQLSADAVVVDGSVRVNESLVTGESDEIVKTAGDTLLSGSFVVSGKCKAVLENVGLESYAARLAMEVKAGRKKQQTEMMRSLDKMVKIIGIFIIPIGIALFTQSYFFLHNSLRSSVVSVVASLVGMIPEGLYLLASVALVVSVIRLGRKNVLVHEMACVETLARVNVLCVDKTGTITDNNMNVQDVVIPDEKVCSVEDAYRLIGSVTSRLSSDNITMEALKQHFDLNTDYEEKNVVKVYPFSSENKYSGVEFTDGKYVIGAPEFVLNSDYDKYKDDIGALSENGARVLAFARVEAEELGKVLKSPARLYAFVVMSNGIRENAKETFAYFQEQNVDIKVISGDNAMTASRVAVEAGIKDADKYIDASELKTDEDYEMAVSKYNVFGRVIPEQKRKLILALKKAGKVVAMTGDGVNDVLALKAADCSIAMASGSEAASNASQIVLLDSDFARMPSVVMEGRRVVNNIQRSASLFLVKNVFSILMTIFTLLAANLYPLYPTQISLLGAFTIGIPAFVLALQPNKSLIKGHFLMNVYLKALPAGLTDFITVAVIAIYGNMAGIKHEYIATMAILTMITVGMATLIKICQPFDILRGVMCAAMLVGIILSILYLNKLFAVYLLPANLRRVTAIAMVCSVPLLYAIYKLTESITDHFVKHSKTFNRILNG